MLPKNLKIGYRPRVEHVLRKGRRLSGKFWQWRFLPSTRQQSHFAVVVSGKISKKAVERNAVRRRVYEAIRKNCVIRQTQDDMKKTPAQKTCYDIVVLCSASALKATYQQIEHELLFTSHQLGL
ncbi:MAG: ribonuclease P protein component [Patescibacteria group bacterium]